MILVSNKNYKQNKHNIISSDFFLLLLEYLEKIKEKNYVIDNSILEKDERTDAEKICQEFINECIEKNSDSREKSKDVYDRYIDWNKREKNDTFFSNKEFKKLMCINGNEISYSRAVYFNRKTYPGFLCIIYFLNIPSCNNYFSRAIYVPCTCNIFLNICKNKIFSARFLFYVQL